MMVTPLLSEVRRAAMHRLLWAVAAGKAKQASFPGIPGSERRNKRPGLSRFSYKVGALNELLSEVGKDKVARHSLPLDKGIHSAAGIGFLINTLHWA